jgi:hypothetical protein
VALTRGTPEQEVWGVRLNRRRRRQFLLDPVVRELGREMVAALGDYQGRHVVVDGRWTKTPAAGDDELLERRLADIHDRLGEHLGIGPRPR